MRRLRLVALVAVALLGGATPSFAQAEGQTYGIVHSYKLTADFTDANASGAQNIPGLQFFLPAGPAQTWKLDCDVSYSQATVVADNFGIQFATAPTNAQIGGVVATNATAFAAGTPATITNNSNNNVVAFTPAVTTVLYAHLGGYIEMPATTVGTQVTLTVTQSTAANVVVIKRGSGCTVSATP